MASVADRFHRLAGTVGVKGEGAGACRTFLPWTVPAEQSAYIPRHGAQKKKDHFDH